jgi:hypothetical protein
LDQASQQIARLGQVLRTGAMSRDELMLSIRDFDALVPVIPRPQKVGALIWSGRWDSNPRPQPWQARCYGVTMVYTSNRNYLELR